MMMLCIVLIYQFTVNKMILKYQSGRTDNERHDRAAKKGEGIVRYSKSKPDDALRAEV